MSLKRIVLIALCLAFVASMLIASVQPMITVARATSPPTIVITMNVSEEMLPCNCPENLVDDAINAPPPTTSNESVVKSPMVPSRNLGDAATTSPPIMTVSNNTGLNSTSGSTNVAYQLISLQSRVSSTSAVKLSGVTVLKMPYEITGVISTSGSLDITTNKSISHLQSRSASLLL